MNAALRHAAAIGAAFLGLTAAPADAQTASHFECSNYEFNTVLPAIEGKDGVFFRTFADLRMQHPLDERTVHMIGQLAKILKKNGTTLIYATIPSKSQVMPQYLPAHAADYGFQPEVADAIYTDFITRLNVAGVVAPDLMTALRANNGGERALFGADFHWTSQGARLGAQAIAEQIKADPAYADLPKQTFVTKAIAPEVAFSGMRRTLQGYCANALPPTETMAYKTDATAGTDDAAGGLDIFATASEVQPAVLVGTSYSDSPINNFAGFLAEYSQLEIVNYAITGGNQFGSMTSYMTSDEFKAQRPRFLIWENPIYNNLAQYGAAPLEELIAAAGNTCTTALPITKLDANTLEASLDGLNVGAEDAIFADFGGEGPREADFSIEAADGLIRHSKIERSQRMRATGNFYLGLSAFAMPDFKKVTVHFDRPVTDATTLNFCANTKGDAS
ncbi:alginate O-acetyltransferase AlgX-related protein [Cypionkella sp.]|uniref:alginate O-acetyltransferase AlgX-related protein n=1 Tax=Cypionkella sp. TaxID=2811411 RepID=UPI002ABC2AAE|nr:hypothetical protein [Cypionkella sp.]MDZ4395112.1 hypothetical protein [Cypionkella sp.]